MRQLQIWMAMAAILAPAYASAQTSNLHIFAKQGDFDNAANCINRHDDVNAFDDDGYTPLMYAADIGQNDIVKILMDNGADPNCLPLYNNEPPALHAAVINNHPVTLDLLLMYERTKPNLLDSAGYTALYMAARNGMLECADVLLFHGANPDIINNSQATALQAAAALNDTAMVGILLRRGAQAGKKTPDGRTAFSVAAEYGAADAARQIFAASADAESGYPVHYAAKFAGCDAIECLHSLGLSMNEPGIDKYTPRDLAIMSGNRSAASKIAQYGGECSSPLLIKCFTVSEFQEFCKHEFRMGLSIGIHEQRSGIALYIGASLRPAYKPALIQKSERLYYQLREKRRLLHLSLEKRFPFSRQSICGFGAYAAAEVAWLSGKYDGSVGIKPASQTVAAPSLGLYGRLKHIGISSGCKYYGYQNELEAPKCVATIAITGYFGLGCKKYKKFGI